MRINPAFLPAILMVVAAGCKPGGQDAGPNGTPAAKKLTKLGIEDSVKGTGATVEPGDDVWVNYTGKLLNGHVFDTNKKEGGEPFHVTVGAGGVIKGWDEGLVGMKQGGKRKLSIPANLAYGSRGQNGIPPDSDLYFDIELLSVLNKKNADVITADDVKVGKGPAAKAGDNVTISYKASANGDEFESQDHVRFKIGADQVQINGFDTSIVGMKVGGERKISIPPMLTRVIHNEKLGMNVGVWDVKLISID